MNDDAATAIVSMDYDYAMALLDSVKEVTSNQIELLVADVQRMLICQRTSKNKEYYDWRGKAENRMLRISEERESLDSVSESRIKYAEKLFERTDSAYYNYVYYEDNYGRIPSLEETLTTLENASETGDVYNTAIAWLSLASYYIAEENYDEALACLETALEDERIQQAPSLVADIHEQMSVVYSAFDDKPTSDYHRNIYLTLQEDTRQDKYMEARAEQLSTLNRQLSTLMIVVIVAILLLVALLGLFYYLNKSKHNGKDVLDAGNGDLEERLKELSQEFYALNSQLSTEMRLTLQNRAKVSLASSIIPLIDRMIGEVNMLETREESEELKNERREYITEIACRINELNDMLTEWIQMRKGMLDLKIESFNLQQLFDIVAQSKPTFEKKGTELIVEPTTLVVKADKTLTLFMINTIADNARKFTGNGGKITISACSRDEGTQNEGVEVSITDTGCGMTEDELSAIFDKKIYDGHGFGLMNCRGIIEKYRKTSKIFSQCMLGAESKKNAGSRFFFRLPAGVMRKGLLILLTIFSYFQLSNPYSQLLAQSPLPVKELSNLAIAKMYADSAYFSNINGTYSQTLVYAESCLDYLNRHYLDQTDGGGENEYDELAWLHDSIRTNYGIIADIRNETAVAALALHDWELYNYNNRMYTALVHALSVDNSIDDFCQAMQRSQSDKAIAVILLTIILLSILPAYYFLYYRHHLRYRRELADKTQEERRKKEDEVEMAEDECRKVQLEIDNLRVTIATVDNCLSTLKHETMYYPNRILKAVKKGRMNEMVSYYRDIYLLLCRQTIRQTEREVLRTSIIPVRDIISDYDGNEQLIGNRVLLQYLFEMTFQGTAQTRRSQDTLSEKKVSHVSISSEGNYLIFEIDKPIDDYKFFLCRQIVRDHSELTGRRACGIMKIKTGESNTIRITLPRIA